MSEASGHNCFDRQDEELDRRVKELERLRRLVRDLELEARGRHRRKDHDEQGEGLASMGGCNGAESHQSRPNSTKIARRNMQIGIRFPRTSNNPETLPWTL